MRSANAYLRVALVALVAASGAGCGQSDEDQAEEALLEYASALRERDFDRACESLSDQTRKLSEEAGGDGGCAKGVEQAAGRTPDELFDPDIRSVQIDGDRADVEIEGKEMPVLLFKEDGDWKVGGG